MGNGNQCLFDEPWRGRCPEHSLEGELCCEKHVKEKCQVCGEQATTRCQASIGVMCGVPLCHYCGSGEMCLDHAGRGPLMVIRALLGAGPISGVFATRETLIQQADAMKSVVARLKKRTWGKFSMAEFDAALERNPVKTDTVSGQR